MRRIGDFLGLDGNVPNALDVACGTGQSAVALKEIADEVVGADASREMLAQAPRDPRVRYVEAAAEDLPFPDSSFDLLTVALALHWFDRARFLGEADRLLRPCGWLVVYDNGFLGRMQGNAGFERWYREDYLPRYPSPPRDRRPLTQADVLGYGFRLAGREGYENEVRFSVCGLAHYLTTQSNVISAVEDGGQHRERALRWLTDCLAPLFGRTEEVFEFGGYIVYLQKERL